MSASSVCVCVCVCVSLRRRSFRWSRSDLSVRVQRRVNVYRRNVRSCKYAVCCEEEYVAQRLCFFLQRTHLFSSSNTRCVSITDLRKTYENVINVDKKKYFEMTAFPLTNVLRLNRNLLTLAISHGSGFRWGFTDFGYIYSKEAYACIFPEAARRDAS